MRPSMRDAAPAMIGPYEIVREIGRGGMGVVYLARDPRLDRQVAVKTLPAELADDGDRLSRFEREAKLLASLNHPNVASIYGVERDGGRTYLVLEYVEGETLEERLARGPANVDESLRIAGQLTEAIEAAHEKGVIHRDLKPANIKFASQLDEPDRIKVLDFGLAKALEKEGSGPVAAPGSPTADTRSCSTLPGAVVGTPGYLSPEQARGYPVDTRTDIFSFGCVLYEMLAGRRAFAGPTVSDAIASLLEGEPDWEALPSDVCPAVRRVLHRCLAKDRRQRLQAIGDVRLELEDVTSSTGVEHASSPSPARSGSLVRAVPWLLVAALAVVVVSLLVRGKDRATPTPAVTERMEVALPPDARIGWSASTPTSLSSVGYSRQIAMSRDGTRLACVAENGEDTLLYPEGSGDLGAHARPRHRERAGSLLLTPTASRSGSCRRATSRRSVFPTAPPLTIGRSISDQLRRHVGPTTTRSSTPSTTVYGGSRSTGCRPPEELAVSNRRKLGVHCRFPHVSADGRWLYITIVDDDGTHAAVSSLDSDEPELRIIRPDASDARVSGGHLVFARGDVIMAAPFDPDRPDESTTAEPIAYGAYRTPGHYGLVVTHFATSEAGRLAYAPATVPPEHDALLRIDPESGATETLAQGEGKWRHPRISPHGDRIMFDIQGADGRRDLFIYEIDRGERTQLTKKGSCFNAEWSPDGKRIA